MSIATVKEIDRKVFETFKEFLEVYVKLDSYPYPKTLSVFMNFIGSTNFIKEAVLDLSETDNNYALKILYRSLIEQYLKFQFIWMRLAEEKNDSIGSDYLEFASYSEDIDYAKAWNKSYTITKQLPEADPLTIIKESNVAFKHLSNAELKSKVSMFNYRNIIEYIVTKLHQQSSGNSNDFLLKLIPEYAELSSFVHGGPCSHKSMYQSLNPEERLLSNTRIAEISVQITAAIKSFTYLAIYQHEKSVGKYYNETNELLKQL